MSELNTRPWWQRVFAWLYFPGIALLVVGLVLSHALGAPSYGSVATIASNALIWPACVSSIAGLIRTMRIARRVKRLIP